MFFACEQVTDGYFAGIVPGKKGGNLHGPGIPRNVRIELEETGKITLAWDPVDDADGYTVYRSSSTTNRYVRRSATAETGYIDSGAAVVPDTQYYYYVSAYNANGVSDQSSIVGPAEAQADPGILQAPEITRATATNGSAGSITIYWTPVSGVQGYFLYRSSEYDDDIYMKITDPENTVYTDSKLQPGTYSYQVKAYNADGEGYMSQPYGPVEVRNEHGDVPPPPLPAPQNLQASVQTGANDALTITVTWSAVAGATEYAVYRSIDDEVYDEAGYSSGMTSWADVSARAGGAYYYRVRSRVVQDNVIMMEGKLSGACGPIVSAPHAPKLSAAITALQEVTLTWTAVYGADGYRVYRSKDDSTYTLLRASGALTLKDTNVPLGRYYYRVTAYNSAGTGVRSDAYQVEVGTSVPHAPSEPGIAINLVSQNDVNLPSQSVSIPRGESRTFQVTGNYKSYQWYLDGTAISGAVSASYTLNTGSMNLGVYELSVIVATDAGARLSGNCDVRID
jgi:fibronectin type 3 domain-containing protein